MLLVYETCLQCAPYQVELLRVDILLPGRWPIPGGYPGTRLLAAACLNGYPGSIFITRVVLLPAGTRVPVYSSTIRFTQVPPPPPN